jgi:hypothetical protein
MINFILDPFPADPILPQIEITGNVDRSDDLLLIEYQLFGDLSLVSIDPPASLPSRRFHLWESTCFEFFIGTPGDRHYWEFNLSPSGDWNVFYLDDYRQGLRDETAFTSLPFTVDRQVNTVRLNLEFDLSKIISLAQPLEMNIDRDLELAVTTVIKSTRSELSYWAVKHSGKEADFHLRDSFTIKI